jgi:hypothetical protein
MIRYVSIVAVYVADQDESLQFITAGIAAGALTDPAAVVHWLGAYAEAGADEVLLVPCSSELMQVDLLAEALSEHRAIA